MEKDKQTENSMEKKSESSNQENEPQRVKLKDFVNMFPNPEKIGKIVEVRLGRQK